MRISSQIRHDVRRVMCIEMSGGRYIAGIRTCQIGITYAKKAQPIALAMMLVHEATHARLASAGVKYRGPERERVERACVDAEVAFAEHVPGSATAIAKARALLDRRWWDDRHYEEKTLTELRSRGVPAWLAGPIVRRAVKGLQTQQDAENHDGTEL